MKIIRYLLGELLHLANSRPPFLWKREFYRMKNSILERHGKVVDMDVQHIVKSCYYCQGLGFRRFQDWEADGAGRDRWQECPRCGTSGKYDEFWVYLFRYQLGRREFHSPFLKTRRLIDAVKVSGATIEGFIEHKHPSYYLHAEAAYWLALLFEPALFRRKFGTCGYPAKKFTPMVIVSDLYWRQRFFIRRLFREDDIPF